MTNPSSARGNTPGRTRVPPAASHPAPDDRSLLARVCEGEVEREQSTCLGKFAEFLSRLLAAWATPSVIKENYDRVD